MPSRNKRLLTGGSFLWLGHLVLAATVAAAEPGPSSPPLPRAEWPVPAETLVAVLPVGVTSDGLSLEVSPASANVKQQEPFVGSALDVPPDAPVDLAPAPGRVSGLVEEPPVEVAVAAEPSHRPEVRYFIERFSGVRKNVVEQWLIRSGRYTSMIHGILGQAGLPEDLIFTAMIESGFNPLAVSHAGAKGLWQFMAATAQRYGLRVDRWLDERLDPEKSTWAAAAYLRDLHAMFGSWHLVQAAYNAGEMRVTRAIQGLRTSDFWQLSQNSPILANETKNFVAAIQAAKVIGRDPDRYGFSVTPDAPVRYENVHVPAGTSLRSLALATGVPERDFQELNPALRLNQTPPGGPYALRVPPGAGPRVEAALARGVAPAREPVVAREVSARPAKAVSAKARTPQSGKPVAAVPSRIHVVKPKETLQVIAQRYGVSSEDLQRWNRLEDAARIHPGDRLRVTAMAPREDGQGGSR
ncbi:MAG: transglycosylase SLT domain-containing protein [Candidatus Rokuibacteriota bacterium]